LYSGAQWKVSCHEKYNGGAQREISHRIFTADSSNWMKPIWSVSLQVPRPEPTGSCTEMPSAVPLMNIGPLRSAVTNQFNCSQPQILHSGWNRPSSGVLKAPDNDQQLLEKGELMTNNRQTWETPALTVYGDVAELTLKDKHTGTSDGFTFNGVPISG